MHFSHGMGNNQARLQSQPEGISCKERVNNQARLQSQPRGFSRMEWVIINQDFRASQRAFLAWNGGFWHEL